jgi:hypothetical protein
LRAISLPETRRGEIDGRRPKLTHKKALIIQTTIFDQRTYDAGLSDAMRMVLDEFTLTYPGIKTVERKYFHAVHGADDATRQAFWNGRIPWVASSEGSSKIWRGRSTARVQRRVAHPQQVRHAPPTERVLRERRQITHEV